MEYRITRKMWSWIILICLILAAIGAFILRERNAAINEKQNIDIQSEKDKNIEQDRKIISNESKINELYVIIKTSKDLNLNGNIETNFFKNYGYNPTQIDLILKKHKENIVDKLDQAVWYFSNNDYKNALKLFEELLQETNTLEVDAVCYAYLGSIYIYYNKLNLSLVNLKKAEDIFKSLDDVDQSLKLIRASNYYQLAFYYKTMTNEWDRAKEYYLRSIDLYEKLNQDGANSNIQLGKVYNDLYVMLDQSNLEINAIPFLDKAIFYKKEVLQDNYSLENLDLLYNSIKAKGNYFLRSELFDEAINIFSRTIDEIEKISDNSLDKKFLKAEFLVELANVYLTKFKLNKKNKDLISARELLEEAEIIYRQIPETSTYIQVIGLRNFYYSKGALQVYQKLFAEGLRNLQNCIDLNRKIQSLSKGDLDIIEYEAHIFYKIATVFYLNQEIKDCHQVRIYAEKAMKIYNELKSSRNKSKEFYQISLSLFENCK